MRRLPKGRKSLCENWVVTCLSFSSNFFFTPLVDIVHPFTAPVLFSMIPVQICCTTNFPYRSTYLAKTGYNSSVLLVQAEAELGGEAERA